jgi:hypothetical protein
MSDELKERNILKLILIVRFACAPLDMGHPIYESVCRQLNDEITMENVVDQLLLLSATRNDISTQLEFIAYRFSDLFCRRDALETLPFL